MEMDNINREEAEKMIPKGVYCYDDKVVCPFWSKSPDHPHQESGYCGWLKEGDWESEGSSLLWDQCKECGINLGEIKI